MIWLSCLGVFVATTGGQSVWSQSPPSTDAAEKTNATSKEKKDSAQSKGWISLKDQWEACEFGGDGDIKIKNGTITVGYGSPISGVRYKGKVGGEKGLPRDNYELEWESQRVDGFDFLCAFTFPIQKSHVSFVMGGWGGGITGISSIDGRDASDNETTMFKAFDNKKWYKSRVRIDPANITVWVDDKMLFEQPRAEHKFDIRFEMDPCTPFGIANYECISEFKNIRIRPLSKQEIATAKKSLSSETTPSK